jgi:hypothetical protein
MSGSSNTSVKAPTGVNIHVKGKRVTISFTKGKNSKRTILGDYRKNEVDSTSTNSLVVNFPELDKKYSFYLKGVASDGSSSSWSRKYSVTTGDDSGSSSTGGSTSSSTVYRPTNISTKVNGKHVTINFTKGRNSDITELADYNKNVLMETSSTSFSVPFPQYNKTYAFYLRGKSSNGSEGEWTRKYTVTTEGGSASSSYPNEYLNSYKIKVKTQSEDANNGKIFSLPTCTSHAVIVAKEILDYKSFGLKQAYSYMWLHGLRKGNDSVTEDGRSISGLAEYLIDYGVPAYSSMPNSWLASKDNEADNSIYGSPNKSAVEVVNQNFNRLAAEARKNTLSSYRALDEYDTESIKRAIYKNGCCVISFDKHHTLSDVENDGIVYERQGGNNQVSQNSGHAMTLVGWKVLNNKLHWVGLNTWNSYWNFYKNENRDIWGDEGYCYIPFDYASIDYAVELVNGKCNPQTFPSPVIHTSSKNDIYVSNMDAYIPLIKGANFKIRKTNGETVDSGVVDYCSPNDPIEVPLQGGQEYVIEMSYIDPQGKIGPVSTKTFTAEYTVFPPTNITRTVKGKEVTITFTKGRGSSSTYIVDVHKSKLRTLSGSSVTIPCHAYESTYHFYLRGETADGRYSEWEKITFKTGKDPISGELVVGEPKRASIKNAEVHWYPITFDRSGKADFILHPESSDLDVDLYIYKGSMDGSKVGSSTSGRGRDDKVLRINVDSGTKYYVKVSHYSGNTAFYTLQVNAGIKPEKPKINSSEVYGKWVRMNFTKGEGAKKTILGDYMKREVMITNDNYFEVDFPSYNKLYSCYFKSVSEGGVKSDWTPVYSIRTNSKLEGEQLGDNNKVVTEIQKMLHELNYLTLESQVDGYYGQNTKTALITFQRANKLPTHGIADIATRRRLKSLTNRQESLKLKSFTFSDQANAGKESKLRVNIENTGNVLSENYKVKLYVDGVFYTEKEFSPLSAGAGTSTYMSVKVDLAKTYKIKAKIVGESTDEYSEDVMFRYNIQNLLDAAKIGASVTDINNLIDELVKNQLFTPVALKLMKDIRKAILEKMGINPEDCGVIGVVTSANGKFIIGGRGRGGGYISHRGDLMAVKTSGILIETDVSIETSVSIVLLPFLQDISKLTGVGITLGGSIGPVSADITNAQLDTICISLGCGVEIGAPTPVEGYIFAGYTKEIEASRLTEDQMDSLMNRINRGDFGRAL